MYLSYIIRVYISYHIYITHYIHTFYIGIFENSSVSRILQAESASIDLTHLTPSDLDTYLHTHTQQTHDLSHTPDSYKMMIAILTTQSNEYKSQIQSLTNDNTLMKTNIYNLDMNLKQILQQLHDSECMIGYLENERTVFRDMLSDLKSGIVTFGGVAGQNIINQIRENAMEREKEGIARHLSGPLRSFKTSADNNTTDVATTTNTNGSATTAGGGGGGAGMTVGFDSDVMGGGEGGGPDDDSESVIAEFNDLAEEIQRTGGLASLSSLAFSTTSAGGGGKPKGVVYDRLTNPLNFTGSMKNVFEKDVAVKRQKVQRIKNQIQVPVPHNPGRVASIGTGSIYVIYMLYICYIYMLYICYMATLYPYTLLY